MVHTKSYLHDYQLRLDLLVHTVVAIIVTVCLTYLLLPCAFTTVPALVQ